MQTQTVTISESAHQILRHLADLEKTSVQTVPDRALEIYRREVFLKQPNDAFAALKANPEAWAEEVAERELWERTITDVAEDQ